MSFGSSAAQRINFERLMHSYAPVSWWKLNEASGSTFTDYGSAGIAATLNGTGSAGVVAGATGPATASRPTTNNALRVDNSAATAAPSPTVCIGSQNNYQIFGTTDDATIGCFVRINTAGTQGFYNFPQKQGAGGFRQTITVSTRVIGFLWHDGTTQYFPSNTFTLPNDGAWHMVAGIYNRSIPGGNGTGAFTSFLNGVSQGYRDFPAGFGSCNNTGTSMYPVGGANTPNGVFEFSDVFIIPRMLSTQQVRALYRAGIR